MFNEQIVTQLKDFKVGDVMYCAIDAGSTATRRNLTMRKGEIGVMESVPAQLGIYYPTKNKISPNSSALEDNLYLVINRPISAEPIHILLGNLVKNEICQRLEVSQDNKCLSEITQLNTIAAIALGLLKFDMTDIKPRIALQTTFRPKDMRLPENVETYKEMMVGEYSVEFPLLEKTVRFVIEKKEDIVALSEPTATIIETKFKYRDKNLSKLVLVDGGGTSIDSIMGLGNSIIASKADNAATGGEDLKNKFIAVIAQNIGFDPTEEQIEEVLTKGTLTAGNKVYDLSNYMKILQDNIAQYAKKEIVKQLQLNSETFNSINAVVLTGRLFGTNNSSKGAVELIKNQLSQYAGLEVIHNSDEFSIVKGLTLLQSKVC